MTAIQESDIEVWKKDSMAMNSLKSIIIQIERNRLLTEEQKKEAIRILTAEKKDEIEKN